LFYSYLSYRAEDFIGKANYILQVQIKILIYMEMRVKFKKYLIYMIRTTDSSSGEWPFSRLFGQ